MLLALQSCFSQQSPLTFFTNNRSAVIALQQDTRYAECKMKEFVIITLITVGDVNSSIQLTVQFPSISTPLKYVFNGIEGTNIDFAILNFSSENGYEKQLIKQIEKEEFDLHDCIELTEAYVAPNMRFISFLLKIGSLVVCPDFVNLEKYPNGTYRYIEELQYITFYDEAIRTENMLTGSNIRLVAYDERNPCGDADYVVPSYNKQIELARCCEKEFAYECSFQLEQILQSKTSFFEVEMTFKSRFGQEYVVQDIECLHNSPEYSPHLHGVNMTIMDNSIFFECNKTNLSMEEEEYLSDYKMEIGIVYSDDVLFFSPYRNASYFLDDWILDCGRDPACESNLTALRDILEYNLDVRIKYMIYIYYEDDLAIEQRVGVFIPRADIFIDEKSIEQIEIQDSSISVRFTVSETQYFEKIAEPVALRVYDTRLRHLYALLISELVLHGENEWKINNQSLASLISERAGQLIFILEDERGVSTTTSVVISQESIEMFWFFIMSVIGFSLILLNFIASKAQERQRRVEELESQAQTQSGSIYSSKKEE